MSGCALPSESSGLYGPLGRPVNQLHTNPYTGSWPCALGWRVGCRLWKDTQVVAGRRPRRAGRGAPNPTGDELSIAVRL